MWVLKMVKELVSQLDCVDVWDCHGVLKNSNWGIGYGCTPDITKLGLRWEKVGYFTIPLPKDYPELNEDVKKQVEQVLFEAVQRNGAINISGWYDFYGGGTDGDRLLKALNGKLKEADIDNIVNMTIKLLKKNPMHALLTWSSTRAYGCADGCRGYHVKTYVYYDGKSFYMFNVGRHHAWCQGMWDIKPEKIDDMQKLRQEIKARIEWDIESEGAIFEGEEDDHINWLTEELIDQKLAYCEKHDTYYWNEEECPECEPIP